MGCNNFGGQTLAKTCSFVGGHIVVQQAKISTAERSWTNTLNSLQEEIHYCFIKFCIYCISLWYEFFVHYGLKFEKIINLVLRRDLWNFSYFGRGDVSQTNSELSRFVSLSKANHQASNPVIIVLKGILSASVIAIISCQDVTRSYLCSGVKDCGTKLAHTFLFPQILF